MANFQRPIDASPDAECQLLSDTAARREQKMTRKCATMRVLASCYAVSATGQEAYRGRTRLGTRITEDAGVSLRCMSPLLARLCRRRHPTGMAAI